NARRLIGMVVSSVWKEANAPAATRHGWATVRAAEPALALPQRRKPNDPHAAAAADLARRLLPPARVAHRPQAPGRPLPAARAGAGAVARRAGIPRPGAG